MKSKSREISIADYNRILLNDAMLWLEAAVNEVREAKDYCESVESDLGKLKEKFEQLRLDL